jgi:hypothetical protein
VVGVFSFFSHVRVYGKFWPVLEGAREWAKKCLNPSHCNAICRLETNENQGCGRTIMWPKKMGRRGHGGRALTAPALIYSNMSLPKFFILLYYTNYLLCFV